MTEPGPDSSGSSPRRRLALVSLLLVGGLVALQLVRSARTPRFASFDGEAMSTTWQITLPEGSGTFAARNAPSTCSAERPLPRSRAAMAVTRAR